MTTILSDIEGLRTARPPAAHLRRPVSRFRLDRASAASQTTRSVSSWCRAGHQTCGSRLQCRLAAEDAIAFGALFTDQGDLVHGDGTIERGRRDITENSGRAIQDARVPRFPAQSRLYHHPLHQSVGCGRRREVGAPRRDGRGRQAAPRAEGLSTLVLQGGGGAWPIEAYRYNTKSGSPAGPTLLKKPGYPDK